jgi:uncharacterized membrane protein
MRREKRAGRPLLQQLRPKFSPSHSAQRQMSVLRPAERPRHKVLRRLRHKTLKEDNIMAYKPPIVPGEPQQADIRDAQEGRTMAILAYILFFIPLLTGAHKASPFVRFHTNQGTVLFILAAIYGIAYGILSVVLALIPVVGWALIIILGIASAIFPILCAVGIINAVNGKMRPLPAIGGITLIK